MSAEVSEKNLQALSRLMDGDATEQELDALLRAWNEDPTLRRDWHALHLAGETLRAPDLDEPVQSREALLSGLRQRIAAEPTLLRPRSRGRWLPPLGVAAGFVMLALLLPRAPLPAASSPLALQSQAAQALVSVPGSRTLDAQTSFVRNIVAPEQPGLASDPQSPPQQQLLQAPPPFPTASAASVAIH